MSSKERTPRNDKESTKQRLPKPAIENSYLQVQQQTHPATIIQRAGLDPRALSPNDVLQLQRSIGNRAVGKLMAGIAQQPQPTVLPTATAFGGEVDTAGSHATARDGIGRYEQNSDVVQRLRRDGNPVNIDTLNYDQCLEYRDYILRNRENPGTYPNIVEENGDLAALRNRIQTLKANAPNVKVTEGSIDETGSSWHGLDYGHVDTCMTITCHLLNGRLVGIHEALGARVPGGLGALRTRAQQIGTIFRVEARGAHQWSYGPAGLTGLCDPQTLQPVPVPQGNTSVAGNHPGFEQWLSAQLGAPAEFTHIEGEHITVSPWWWWNRLIAWWFS